MASASATLANGGCNPLTGEIISADVVNKLLAIKLGYNYRKLYGYTEDNDPLMQYITNLTVETGRLFDIGFRIGDGIATPDDLFMSDGPWGIDDSQDGTTVGLYNVTENDYDFTSDEFPIERFNAYDDGHCLTLDYSDLLEIMGEEEGDDDD